MDISRIVEWVRRAAPPKTSRHGARKGKAKSTAIFFPELDDNTYIYSTGEGTGKGRSMAKELDCVSVFDQRVQLVKDWKKTELE
jgi:hypothetical protein